MVRKCKKTNMKILISKLQKNLETIDLKKIKTEMKEFFLMDLKKYNEDEIKQLIMNIINPEKGVFANFKAIKKIEKGLKLYRIRKLTENEDFKIKEKSELWNPPEEMVKKYGRLNILNESVLYTSLNPETCLQETEIKVNDCFLLLEYRTLYETNFINIFTIEEIEREVEYFPLLSNECKEKLQLINTFIIKCFQMNNYIVSNIIKSIFYTDEKCDGWIYSSIKNSDSKNIVLLPEIAKENKLKIEKITVFKKIDEETLETIYNVGLNTKGKFIHLKPFD